MKINLAIFRLLRNSPESLSLAQLGKKIAASRQAIDYQLKQMVNLGIIIKQNNKYALQPFLCDDSIENDLFSFFATRLNDFKVNVQKTCNVESSDIIHAGLTLFCELFLDQALCLMEAK